MKLLNKTARIYLFSNIPFIIITMVCIYFSIRHYNQKHVENSLKEEKELIDQRSEKIKHYFIEDELSDELIIEKINADQTIEDRFSTVLLFDKLESEMKPYRQLETSQYIAGEKYRFLIRKSLVENSTLLYSIGVSVFILILFLSIISFFLNRVVLSEKIWNPFYGILSALKRFKAGENYAPNIQTNIEEFNELDNTLREMTEKINKDFFIYKEFIDIVSHEYQTPLAVIGNNAELLLQNTSLQEDDFKSLSKIIEYTRKLNRLNKSLLLLSRIDNQQFKTFQKVSVIKIIKNLIAEKKHQIEHKEISVKLAFDEDIILDMDPVLADVLFGNLLQNAIRHNYQKGGNITIEIRKGNFHIYNLGEVPKHNNDEIFLKFFKESSTKKSIGLGLSIVKSVCQQYDFNVMYEFDVKRHEHHFMLRF